MRTIVLLVTAFCLAGTLTTRAGNKNASSALTIGTAQVHAYVNKRVTVTGVVAQVSIRSNITFLNFDKPYPNNPFAAIIRARSTNEFENVSALKGRTVSVKGEVREYKGRPEMELIGKYQLKILGEAKDPKPDGSSPSRPVKLEN
jgi:hypothetical protein